MIEFPLFAPFLLLPNCFFVLNIFLLMSCFSTICGCSTPHLALFVSSVWPRRDEAPEIPRGNCAESLPHRSHKGRDGCMENLSCRMWDVPSTNHWTIDRVRLRLESYNHGLFNPKKLVFKPYNYGNMSTCPSTDTLTWETRASWPMLNTFHTFIDLKWWRHSCDARATWVSICACWRQITGLWDPARIV